MQFLQIYREAMENKTVKILKGFFSKSQIAKLNQGPFPVGCPIDEDDEYLIYNTKRNDCSLESMKNFFITKYKLSDDDFIIEGDGPKDKGPVQTAYRGIGEDYVENYQRHVAHGTQSTKDYADEFIFTSLNPDYAKGFGGVILEYSIHPNLFFDLEKDWDKGPAWLDAGVEYDSQFANWLIKNGYEGYTRIDSDDGTDTDEDDREYVLAGNWKPTHISFAN
jgi:hypothetical protein